MERETLLGPSHRRERLSGRPSGPSAASVVLPDDNGAPPDIVGLPERTIGSRVSRKRLVSLFRFGLVGMTGLLVNQAVLWAITEVAGVHYLLSAVVATQASTIWNFALAERWVFRARRSGRARRFMWFVGINNGWLAARTPMLFALTGWVGLHYLVSNIVVLVASMLARFLVADTWIWTGEKEPRRPRRFLYDIHGIVRIASAARLPELGAFRVQAFDGPADLQLTIGNRGFGGLRRRPLVETKGEVTTYVEHLGGFGFAVRIDMATPVKVQASRFLGRSPYVLYTNVVEPTLRWLFVRKGYALAHAACLEVAGKGLLITAQTDTGKTTTCLRTIRAHGARFLSDDMTILTPAGEALSYPKPMTISAHTLRAVQGAPFPWWRWPWLLVQSRVHSKNGRRFGMWLARRNLPVATISALVQMVVPPPKFFVERLIPGTETKPSLPLTHMIVIERGGELVQQLSVEEAGRVLLANTEDAYGFPPYPLIAEGLHDGDAPIEGSIQRSVLGRIAVSRVRSPDRNWFDQILPLIGQPVESNPDVKPQKASPQASRELHLRATSDLGHRRARRLRNPAIARVVLPLVGIFAVAVFLRTWRLGAVGFGGDEAVYAGQASVLAGNEGAERFFVLMSRGNSNFLLFQHVVSIFYRLFGVSDVAARLVAVGFSSATVLLTYALGRLLYGRVTGLLAAGLLAVSGSAVALGRLAMLDSTLTFLFALTMVAFVVWDRTRKTIWLCLAAAASALTVQAKVSGALVLLAIAIYLVINRRLSRLRPAPLLIAGATFIFFFLPAAVQLARHWDEFWRLLGDSSHRSSQVGWTYYIRTLARYDGYLLPSLWLVGAAVALRRRSDGDKLLLVWVAAVVTFHQLYPLKAFNYLLPAIPAFCVMTARALWTLGPKLATLPRGIEFRRRIGVPQVASVVLLPGLLGVGSPPLEGVLRADDFAGLREAAYRLKERAEPGAGVMVLSNGSAQYTFSFYAGLDAYPFGRFRLATILPGGHILRPGPTPAGRPPTDWISSWPPWLIRDGTVSYLVFHTTEGDDPPENPIVSSGNQRDFQALVEAYGGKLVHREYHEHEARVWVYQVTKVLPAPRLTATWLGRDPAGPGSVRVSGRGFHIDSRVALFFRGQGLGVYPTDDRGAFSARVALGEGVEPRYWLLARDLTGNEASVSARHIKKQASIIPPGRLGSTEPSVSGLGSAIGHLVETAGAADWEDL
jgi:putative flippase GtrA